jgi:hypothetical protein
MNFNTLFNQLLAAGYPCIHLDTPEPPRAINTITTKREIFIWDCIEGITEQDGTPVPTASALNPIDALAWLSQQHEAVLFCPNFHHFLHPNAADIHQAIYNGVNWWKARKCTLVTVGPRFPIPQEVSRYFAPLSLALPDVEDHLHIQQQILDGIPEENRPAQLQLSNAAAHAAKGLTDFEAETAYAFSVVTSGVFCPDIVVEQKKEMIRKTGMLEFYPPVSPDQVGGLKRYISWLTNRLPAFEPNSTKPQPNGIMLLGPTGTGKSLVGQATAAILGRPLIVLNPGALKGSLVGETERNTRLVLSVIEAFGDCVLFIDEVEKFFSSSSQSTISDGNTSTGMLGTFLTWRQERGKNCVLVCTSNNVNALPPEFVRPGRFDAVFFVDVPNPDERLEIARIMDQRYNTALATVPTIINDTNGWTGAEIEQLAKDTIFDGYDEAATNIVPMSKTTAEAFESLRKWSVGRTRPANTPTDTAAPSTRRDITPGQVIASTPPPRRPGHPVNSTGSFSIPDPETA